MSEWHTMAHRAARAAPRLVYVKGAGFVVARYDGEKWVRFDLLVGDHEEIKPVKWMALPRTPYERVCVAGRTGNIKSNLTVGHYGVGKPTVVSALDSFPVLA